MAKKAREARSAKVEAVKVPRALQDWMDRTGAEQLNHRRYMVRRFIDSEAGKRSYYVERSVLSITRDGDVRFVGQEEHRPTDEELDAIEACIGEMDFPKSITTTYADAEAQRRKLGIDHENWFVLPTLDRKEVITCQERKDQESGDKAYYPHTKFSDGKWRMMEPDNALPFWKPAMKRPRNKIMIHEGCKAARHIDWLINSETIEAIDARKNHPWLDTLEDFEHWGITGGALAPHRADFEELKKAKAKEVIYACDRDRPGESALQIVSKHYGETLTGIRFNKGFPDSWDMADPMPKDFVKGGLWFGPTLESLMLPATWATYKVPVEGSKKGAYVLKQSFKDEWYHTVSPEVYIHAKLPSAIYYGAEDFNNAMSPFSDKRNLHELIWKDAAGKSNGITFNPGEEFGFSSNHTFNVFRPSELKAVKGDATMFYEYLNHLIPLEEDRIELMRWCATLSECPAVRMHYGVLLISRRQGVGKTTLGTIMEQMVGPHNVKRPSEGDIVDSAFNTWQENCRLILADEIYAGHSFKAYHKLKTLITDRMITINRKFQSPYVLPNYTHMIASSNSMNALKIPNQDRRWFIPGVTEQKPKKEFWDRFYPWLETGGFSIIKHEFEKFIKKHGAASTGSHAPDTKAKARIVEESLSMDEKLAVDVLDHLREKYSKGDRAIVLTDWGLYDYILHAHYDGKLDRQGGWRLSPIRNAAEERGWHVSAQRKANDKCGPTLAHWLVLDEKLADLPQNRIREVTGGKVDFMVQHADFPWVKG